MNTSTAAPLPSTSGQASGTLPILGSGPLVALVGTAKYWAHISQMELMITGILAHLAAIEEGLQITSDLPSTDGQARHYKCALKIPNSLVSHIIGHQGQGLKQAHNLSGSWLATFVVGPAENEGCQFATIRGTDQQIGKALVVIGKHIAKRQVRTPWKQKTGNAVLEVAAPAPSSFNSDSVSSTSKPPTQQKQPSPNPTLSQPAATPTLEEE
ncbi:hypothetical protein C0995_014651 [Termitomyces sp. Mi166|nr:hypothetical protein C0995_014651 [Termitomyces sp. Mi166\